MKSESSVCHSGIVVGSNNEQVLVKIIAQSACAGCHAKNMCNISESEEKVIEVSNTGSKHYKTGEQVTITMKRSMGNKAVLIGYVLPFLIVLISIFVISYFSGNEAIAGLLALLLLAPYYLGLYLLRKGMKQTFRFELE